MAQPSRKPEHGMERARTDAGLTGDKVAASDPAAAPVQTDAETAGVPTQASRAAASAERQEKSAGRAVPNSSPAPFAALEQPRRGPAGGIVLTAAVMTILVAFGVVAGLVSVAGL